MSRVRWALWLPLALFALFCAVVVIQLVRPTGNTVTSKMIGKPLPEFNLRAASPDRPGVSTADFRDGKPKLLNIFGSWCIPCIAEAPQLAELERHGATIIGVDLRDHPDDLAAYLARNGDPYARIGADDLSEVQLGIGSSGVPETYVIDGNGVIRYQHIGDIRAEEIPFMLEKLKEAGA